MTAFIENLKAIQVDQNSAYDYLVAFFILVAILTGLKIFQLLILSRLKNLAQKTREDFDDILIQIFSELKPPIYFFIALYFSTKAIIIAPLVAQIIDIFFVIAIVYEIIQAAGKIVDYFTKKYLEKTTHGENKKYGTAMVRALKGVAKTGLWIIGVLLILSNLGVNITSFVASLGIGGLAIALALQNVLSDVFSSFSIYFDKPFREGDFIVVGSDAGTVQKIGIKSTRIKTLQGEELVISNRELTTARVQNFKKMESRRVTFTLGIVYGTKAEKLEQIPIIVKNIVNEIENVDFDRCHFRDYGDFSLNYEVVFFINSPDYNVYMDLRQKINLAIYKAFEKEKISFAYPTQTIHLEKA